MSLASLFLRLSRRPTSLPSVLTAARSMGGGPRTFPGGLSKWQYKRMHEKLAKEKERKLLHQEKQLYQARLRSEIRAKAAGGSQSSPSNPSSDFGPMSSKDHIKALADRFMKQGAEDLWNDDDGPISEKRPPKLAAKPLDLKKIVKDGRSSVPKLGSFQQRRDYSKWRRNSSSEDEELDGGGLIRKELKISRFGIRNEEEEEEEERGGEEGEEREEREIRSSVGLDPTLDNEDEEDEYDRAALCRENASERVYMKDVKEHGRYVNYHAVVPDFLDEPSDKDHTFNKDPRADHFASSVRLEEDKNAAGSCPPVSLRSSSQPSGESQVKMTESDVNVKPILKRKEAQVEQKPKKRVRFDPEYINDIDELSEEPQGVPMVPQTVETSVVAKVHNKAPEESPGIPDYLRNPSKYTCYTFDSSEGGDEENNKQNFEDFCKLVKRSEPDDLQPDFPVDLPNSVAFTPRKKSADAVPMDDSPINSKEHRKVSDSSVGVAAGEVNISDACEMDEDHAEASSVDTTMSMRRGRQYRAKLMMDDDSSD